MKIKDLERTVNISWSPKSHFPILLATGTAAQQLDASFNTNAALEVYSPNFNDPGMDLELKASTPSDNRFYKVVWGSYGMTNDKPSGVIVGGCDGGIIQIYDAAKLLSGEDCLISRQDKHTGPVQSLDFNPFQNNLLASGASDSEIFIWDLNNTNTPMTPGTKSQPLETVQCLSWNRQVQHILATTFSTRCVVWDLRKNEPIIKLTDTGSHIRWKYVSWHPEVATQLCLASEEDQSPVIQLWDLRFATSPLKVLDNHHRGVLSVAWCNEDPDLLISCGKDNRILCWNPNSNETRGEVLSEIAETIQWNFDVAWCPRNPAIIAASSFDGHVSIYSLMGGKQQQVQTSNKIADSFPGMDGYVQAPLPQQAPPISVDLTKAPKWLKRPVGASFAFGGKLIIFENDKTATTSAQPGHAPTSRTVQISQVVTEPDLIQEANKLEQTLQMGNYAEYCRQKADSTLNQHERYIWHFLKANFHENPKLELLQLLGFCPEDVNSIISKKTEKLNLSADKDLQSDAFNTNSLIDNNKISEKPAQKLPYKIKTGEDTDGLITQAILVGNIEAAVELCMNSNRMADALIIAMTGGSDLLARTQHRYLQKSEGYVSSLISALVSEDWSSVINECSVESWKEALAAALTYCSSEELPFLCERLGERLETESNGDVKLLQDAQLCYICAGSFNKLVHSWSSDLDSSNNSKKLQELVELVTFMQKAMEVQGRTVDVSGNLADLLAQYAILLASQGNLNNALNYLGSSSDPTLNELRERLYCNLGHKNAYQQQQQIQQNAYPSRRASNLRTSFSNSSPSIGQNISQASSSPLPNQPGSFQPPQFNTGLPNKQPSSVQQPSWNSNPIMSSTLTQTYQTNSATSGKPFTPVPPPATIPPPRPTSASGTRNKYIVDPSVQSNLPTAYNPIRSAVTNNNNFMNPMMAPTSAAEPGIPPVPQFKQPMQSSILTPTPIQTQPQTIGSFPLMQQQQQHQQLPPPMPSSNSHMQSSSIYNPQNSSSNMNNNVEMAQPAINSLNQQYSAPPGWNDPPIVNKSIRPQPKMDNAPPPPITHPLCGSNPAPEMNNFQTNEYGETSTMNPGFYGQMPPPQVNNFTPINQQQQQQQQFQPASIIEQRQTPTPQQTNQGAVTGHDAMQPKRPIPEEHMYLQTVFNELQVQCTCAANNPQTKRKLEDVSRKLETLYDMLRDYKLSPQTLASLHQMVQRIQVGDYTGGLALHTQLVSGPDFSQIASFMPGLKVLLQCALQLQVYLR